MKKGIAFIIFFFLSNFASANEISYRDFLALNNSNVSKISVGMSEEQVRSIMGIDTSKVKDGPLGNPWKIDRFGDSAIYHYLTRKHPPFTPILENQATPVLFKDGKVVGIGRQYLKQFRDDSNSTNSSQTATGQNTIEERIETLNNLLKSGAIDNKTYEDKKNKILDEI